jgi:hypothetical protein
VLLALSLSFFVMLGITLANQTSGGMGQSTADLTRDREAWQPVMHTTAPHGPEAGQLLSGFMAERAGEHASPDTFGPEERNPLHIFGDDDRVQMSPADPRVA